MKYITNAPQYETTREFNKFSINSTWEYPPVGFVQRECVDNVTAEFKNTHLFVNDVTNQTQFRQTGVEMRAYCNSAVVTGSVTSLVVAIFQAISLY